jgi:hypothetical protein
LSLAHKASDRFEAGAAARLTLLYHYSSLPVLESRPTMDPSRIAASLLVSRLAGDAEAGDEVLSASEPDLTVRSLFSATSELPRGGQRSAGSIGSVDQHYIQL